MRNSNSTLYKQTKNFVSNRTKSKKEVESGVNSTFITMVGLVIFLFIYYLGTLNANATLGYDIRELNVKISQLKAQKDTMENKIDIIKSLNNINNDSFSKTDMVEMNDSISLVVKDDTQYVYNN